MSEKKSPTKFSNIEELSNIMNQSPEDKNVSFRVGTWRMVLEEIVNLKRSLLEMKSTVKKNKETQTQKLNEIQKSVKEDIKNDLSANDADILLF